SNQLRNLVVQLYIRLQHVEPWNCSRFEPVLLVVQLSFQQTPIFLVHLDEFSLDHDLVELRFHSRDELVQSVAKREVGAVSLKKCAANLVKRRAVENQLSSKNTDGVRNIAKLHIWSGRRCRGALPHGRSSPACSSTTTRRSTTARRVCGPKDPG